MNFRVKSFKVETNISNWQPNVGWWQQLLLLLFCLISFCHSYSHSYRKQSIVNVNKVYDLSMLFLHLSFTFFFLPSFATVLNVRFERTKAREKFNNKKLLKAEREKGWTFCLIKTLLRKFVIKNFFLMQQKIFTHKNDDKIARQMSFDNKFLLLLARWLWHTWNERKI